LKTPKTSSRRSLLALGAIEAHRRSESGQMIKARVETTKVSSPRGSSGYGQVRGEPKAQRVRAPERAPTSSMSEQDAQRGEQLVVPLDIVVRGNISRNA